MIVNNVSVRDTAKREGVSLFFLYVTTANP